MVKTNDNILFTTIKMVFFSFFTTKDFVWTPQIELDLFIYKQKDCHPWVHLPPIRAGIGFVVWKRPGILELWEEETRSRIGIACISSHLVSTFNQSTSSLVGRVTFPFLQQHGFVGCFHVFIVMKCRH